MTQRPGEAQQGAAPSITVIIPTRDRPDDVARCVASVLECDYPDFEVIVVDQGERPAELPEDARLRHLTTSTRGKSSALNEALTHARSEFVAFTDDDCTVAPHWLTHAHELLERDPSIALVFGGFEPAPHDRSKVFIPFFLPERQIILDGRLSYRRIDGVSGGNMAARRPALEAIEGFDVVQGPGAPFRGSEEYDLLYRVLRGGHRIVIDPETTVCHWGARPYADGSAAALLRGYRFARGTVAVKHLRCGDLQVLRDIATVSGRELARAGRNLVRRGRPTGLGTLVSYWRGILAGSRRPLDRRRRMWASDGG